MKHFPRFQYVYNLVKDCKSRVEQCGVRGIEMDEMYKNVNIKIVIVGNFRDKDLHLLTKSTGNALNFTRYIFFQIKYVNDNCHFDLKESSIL